MGMSAILVFRGITVLHSVKSVQLGFLAKIAKGNVVTLSTEKTVNQNAIVPKINVTFLVDVLQQFILLNTKN